MWEKNGLRHGEFDLYSATHEVPNEDSCQVLSIKWSSNSKVLAVEVEEE